VVSVAPFEGAAREAVHALKYENKHAIAPMMGRLMARAARDLEAELVVPTALHSTRRRERGYDQAGLLARAIGRELNLCSDVSVLERVRRTKQQVALGPEERRLNVAGAFEVARPLHGETVLLVDDVYTTGATLEAAATALIEGGAKCVLGVVFGSAEIGQDTNGRGSGRRSFMASLPGRSTR
jgi:ComF family protein